MEDLIIVWGPIFHEDYLDPNVDAEEIHHLTDLGLDYPFHIVEIG